MNAYIYSPVSHWLAEAKETAADLARRVRAELGMGEYEKDPIDSVVDVLHRFGVRVMELRTELRIDGLAARFDSSLCSAGF